MTGGAAALGASAAAVALVVAVYVPLIRASQHDDAEVWDEAPDDSDEDYEPFRGSW